MHVVVIGAGVVGATTALALVERGFEVTLLDSRDAAAEDTSFANGGGVTPCHSEPWNSPGLIGNLFRHLGRPDAPYRLSPLSLPRMGRWGLGFLAGTRKPRFVRNARANIRLGLYSLQCLASLRERYGFEYDQVVEGSMQVYFSRRAMDASLALRRELLDGLANVEPLEVTETIRREPALAPVQDELAGALFYSGHESGDACKFARAVTEAAQRAGAVVKFGTRVQSVVCEHGRFRHVVAGDGRLPADACVVAAGPETPALLRPLGLRIPIHPVRGYSATFALDRADAAPRLPLLDSSRRFVTLRLGERGLRIAGLADFADSERTIPPGRIRTLLTNAAQLLPELADQLTPERAELWAGLRPVTPDGRPMLGETKIPGLFINAGHGPMGWTMACGSAEITADAVMGRAPAMSLADYRVDRF